MYDYAIPSIFSANGTSDHNVHEAFWTEQDANIRGRDYFEERGYKWNYDDHPIYGSGQNDEFDRDYGHLIRKRGNVRTFGNWLALTH